MLFLIKKYNFIILMIKKEENMLMWILVIVGVVILLGIGFSNWFFDNYSWILFLGFVGALIYYYFSETFDFIQIISIYAIIFSILSIGLFFQYKEQENEYIEYIMILEDKIKELSESQGNSNSVKDELIQTGIEIGVESFIRAAIDRIF